MNLFDEAKYILGESIFEHELVIGSPATITKIRSASNFSQIVGIIEKRSVALNKKSPIKNYGKERQRERKKPKDMAIEFNNKAKVTELLNAADFCYYCNLPFKGGVAGVYAGIKTKDHIIPLCWGGNNLYYNIVISCRWCNEEKGNRRLVDFYDHIDTFGNLSAKSRDKKVILENIVLLIKRIEPYYDKLLKPHAEKIERKKYKKASKKTNLGWEQSFKSVVKNHNKPEKKNAITEKTATAHYVNYLGKECPCVGFIDRAIGHGIMQYQNVYYHSGEEKYVFLVNGNVVAYYKYSIETLIKPFSVPVHKKTNLPASIKAVAKDAHLSVNGNTPRVYKETLENTVRKMLAAPQEDFHEK